MKLYSVVLLFITIFTLTKVAHSQTKGGPSSALQSSNILNPNVSVIGWFQGEAGHRQDNAEESSALQLKEVELGFQAVIDPYARADIFVAVEDGEIDVEEGYLTWTHLPFNSAVKVGKFLANFGKFNRIHSPETAFATRPFAHEAYFGEEGLSGQGASLSWHVPNPLFFTNIDIEAINTPEGEEVPGFEEAKKNELTYIGRLGSFIDLAESANASVGFSYANGAAGQEFMAASNSSDTLRTQFYGFDMTLRWKNPRRAIYRSFLWQTEVFWNDREISSTSSENSMGLFSHIEYQFARRWRVGGRYDYTEMPTDKHIQEQGGLVYLTFTPSEYSLVSIQGQHKNLDDNTVENLGFLKVTFNMGPHGTHPL